MTRRLLKVALLHNIISPHVVPLLARLGQEPGVSLKVYFLAASDVNRRWASDTGRGFVFEVLPHRAIRVGRGDVHTFFVNPTIVAALHRDSFDVLVCSGWDSFAAYAAFALCRRLRKPFILWAGSTAREASWRRSLTVPLVRTIVRGSSAWIAYGSRAREYLLQLGADAARLSVAYNTVDVAWYMDQADRLRGDRAAIRRALGIDQGPVALYVGQLIERKGLVDLIRAHALLARKRPGAQLALVGYGPLEELLRRQVQALRVSGVTFAGHVPVTALPRHYVSADCFVLPSHEEVWGLVLNEAAACGLPLVTTEAVGASPDLVTENNGFVVPPGAPAALAHALDMALDRPQMGARSREMIAGKTYEQNLVAFMTAIRSAVDHGGRP